MNAQDLIDRLKNEAPSLSGRVYHAGELTEIGDLDSDTPVAFVHARVPTFQSADGLGRGVVQPLRRRYSVFIRAEVSSSSEDPMETAANEVIAALVGWAPAGEPEHQLEVDSSDEQAPEGRLLTWDIRFAYQDYVRNP